MGEFTGIGWTLRTWNPWRGCKKISPGCTNCYMFTEQRRFGLDPTQVIKTKTWGQPIRWQKALNGTNRKEMVFTWKIIKSCPNLIFQILVPGAIFL